MNLSTEVGWHYLPGPKSGILRMTAADWKLVPRMVWVTEEHVMIDLATKQAHSTTIQELRFYCTKPLRMSDLSKAYCRKANWVHEQVPAYICHRLSINGIKGGRHWTRVFEASQRLVGINLLRHRKTRRTSDRVHFTRQSTADNLNTFRTAFTANGKRKIPVFFFFFFFFFFLNRWE